MGISRGLTFDLCMGIFHIKVYPSSFEETARYTIFVVAQGAGNKGLWSVDVQIPRSIFHCIFFSHFDLENLADSYDFTR